MSELLPDAVLAGFIHRKSWRYGSALIALDFSRQLNSLQAHGSFHDEAYIIHHLVFLLEPFHHKQFQFQVLEIGCLPHQVGLLSIVLGLIEFT